MCFSSGLLYVYVWKMWGLKWEMAWRYMALLVLSCRVVVVAVLSCWWGVRVSCPLLVAVVALRPVLPPCHAIRSLLCFQ